MKTGIVGFFDILGYRSFLNNNDDAAALEVVRILNQLQGSLVEEVRQAFSHYQEPPKVDELVSLLKWLVFSDTILLYSECDDAEAPEKRVNRWLVFHFTSLLLWRRMFAYGLPLRGIIHTGNFFVENTCFAGRAIVEAYSLCTDLDAAVLGYSLPAFTQLVDVANSDDKALLWKHIPTQILEYEVPRKSDLNGRLCLINPLTVLLEDSQAYMDGDLRQLLSDCFCKHNKDISNSAQVKLGHTEQFLRVCRFTMSDKSSLNRMLRYQKRRNEPSII